MSLNEEVDLLRKIPLFAKIEPSKLKLLAFTSERLTFGAGQELFHQGDVGDKAYIIINGEADILVDSPSGELVVAKLGKNDIVGEIAILIDIPPNRDRPRGERSHHPRDLQGSVLPDGQRIPRYGHRDHARAGPTPRTDDGSVACGDGGLLGRADPGGARS